MGIVELILTGLIVGAVARLLVPGRQPMGILLTILAGVVGSLLGWWAGNNVFHADVGRYPFLWAVGGAVLVVLAVSSATGRRGRRWGWR